MLFVQLT